MRAVFLDRDGVINENDQSIEDGPFFVTSPKHLIYRAGALDAIARLWGGEYGFRVFVVSNQPWVDLNFVAANGVMGRIHQKLCDDVAKAGGQLLDSRYIFKGDRTKADAIMELSDIYKVERDKSWMVGDSFDDIYYGKRAGVSTIFVNNQFAETENPGADYEVKSLAEAVEIILNGKDN